MVYKRENPPAPGKIWYFREPESRFRSSEETNEPVPEKSLIRLLRYLYERKENYGS